MKIATIILGLGVALMSLAAVGLAPATAAMGGVLALVIGGFILVIVMDEHDLAASRVVDEPVRTPVSVTDLA